MRSRRPQRASNNTPITTNYNNENKSDSNMNNIVHGLWIGEELPPLAILTIRSFIRHGATFKLWTYNDIKNVPIECSVEDGRSILPESGVFSYTEGKAAGSVAGFSDIFRAKLLYEHGGWWTDMDVTLMQPLESITDQEYLFRKHWNNICVGNLMKVPKGSQVMKTYFDIVSIQVNEKNQDWEKPIRLLGLTMSLAGLNTDIYNKELGHRDQGLTHAMPFMMIPEIRIPSSWPIMHWCNELHRWQNFKMKRDLHPESQLAELFREYNITI